MSELDAVKQLIEQAREGVTAAKTTSEQAQQVAGDKMNEFAMLGLEGVATALNSVADSVATAVGQLAAAYSTADEAVTALSGVTDGTRVSATVQALTTAAEKLVNGGTECGGAGANADNALVLAQETEVEPVMAAVTEAVSAIGEAQSGLQTAAAKANAHAKHVEQSAKGLKASAGGGSSGNHEPIAKIGDPLEVPRLGADKPNHHRTELFGADDDDKEMRRADRAMRVVARNSPSVEKATKDIVQSASSMFRMYKDDGPSGTQTPTTSSGQTQAYVAVPQAKISSEVAQGFSFDGAAVTLTLGSVAAIKTVRTILAGRSKEK